MILDFVLLKEITNYLNEKEISTHINGKTKRTLISAAALSKKEYLIFILKNFIPETGCVNNLCLTVNLSSQFLVKK